MISRLSTGPDRVGSMDRMGQAPTRATLDGEAPRLDRQPIVELQPGKLRNAAGVLRPSLVSQPQKPLASGGRNNAIYLVPSILMFN